MYRIGSKRVTWRTPRDGATQLNQTDLEPDCVGILNSLVRSVAAVLETTSDASVPSIAMAPAGVSFGGGGVNANSSSTGPAEEKLGKRST